MRPTSQQEQQQGQQVVNELRQQFEGIFDRVQKIKQLPSLRKRDKKWINNAVAHFETGLDQIEDACLGNRKTRQASKQSSEYSRTNQQ